MENRAERTVEAEVGIECGAEGVSERKKKWVAPELRKFRIAEVTALHTSGQSPDGAFPEVS